MRATIIILALACSQSISAQYRTDTVPPNVYLHLAGQYMERASNSRDRAWLASLGGALFASGALFTDGKDTHINGKDRFAAWCVLTSGIGIHVGFNLHANGLERKAARILQGNPLE